MITSQQIASPPPGGIFPSSMKFSPDGNLLTFLYPDGKSGQRQVFYVDTADSTMTPKKFSTLSPTTSTDISPEEMARRERMRLFAGGMMAYQWNGSTTADQQMVVPFSGRVLSANKDGNYEVLYDAEKGNCLDPTLSPNGEDIAFVIERDMYVMQKGDAGSVVRLTKHGAEKGVSCGLADYLAQEEMDRYEGFWWSPDSTRIAYTETSENNVPEYVIPHPGKADPEMKESHNYPFAGYENAKVRLAVMSTADSRSGSGSGIAESKSVWMDLAGKGEAEGGVDPNDYYLGRAGWWPDNAVMAQVENRLQNKLQLLRLDPVTGARTVLVEETSKWWVNLYDLLYTFPVGWAPQGGEGAAAKGDFYFLWASERSGFCQLYMYHYQASSNSCSVLLGGKPIGGGGNFVVEDLAAVDVARQVVYFTGNRGKAIEKHLYAASFASEEAAGSIKELTAHIPGFHTVAVSVANGLVADIHSSADQAYSVSMHKFDPAAIAVPEKVAVVYDESRSFASDADEALARTLTRPIFHTIRSLDDTVDLHCALYLPDREKFGPGPYPCINDVYGGPHVMRVLDTWSTTANLRAQRLVQQGCMVMRCDNRGSWRRGIAFEGAVHRDMGNLEVQDQKAAVEHFVSKGLVIKAKVGMIGWSYGGYMSAISMCREPDVWCCSVVGAPVTSWDGYDTHYTERYMGLPEENKVGYESSSVMTHVQNYKGRMLLIHGLIDENVHFRHTARLINKLVEARKCYDLMIFPCERHSPHGIDNRVYLEDGILNFFLTHLSVDGSSNSSSEKGGSSTPPQADMVAANAARVFLPMGNAAARL
jgi:dipeptidyl-peptidase-4